LSFFIIFSGHIIACIWIYVGKILDNNEIYYESWLGSKMWGLDLLIIS